MPMGIHDIQSIFLFLTAKIAPCLWIEQGQIGWEKIILASLRYFFPPNLAQSRHGTTSHIRNRNTGSGSRPYQKNEKYGN